MRRQWTKLLVAGAVLWCVACAQRTVEPSTQDALLTTIAALELTIGSSEGMTADLLTAHLITLDQARSVERQLIQATVLLIQARALAQQGDLARSKQLVADADVIVEGARTAVMAPKKGAP